MRSRAFHFGLTAAVLAAALVAPTPVVSRQISVPQDEGASGVWQTLLKLQTTASAMHTTAHPDDEHGGVITKVSRKDGARLALLTLNRGEAGDNAIGPELFDGLGLIRTEELMVSNAYYGVDDQYFTSVIDYGFSKRLEEAFEKWGREHVLRDVVRVIRMNRPFVLISRFQGTQRDGHGNHQTAGLITQLAFKAAGDPAMFPEQLKDGLRPWQPLKLYIGGMRESEDWTVRVDSGEYASWLGTSYNNFARYGLSFQRSQNSGRLRYDYGPVYGYYKRAGSVLDLPANEDSFFQGIDTTIPGLFRALQRPEPPGAAEALGAIDRAVKDAVSAFSLSTPSATVPALARGLSATRNALARVSGEPDAAFLLKVKEQQFMDAINAALGIAFEAVAVPANTPEPAGELAMFAPALTMAAVVPGQTFEVRALFSPRGHAVAFEGIRLEAETGWAVQPAQSAPSSVIANAVAAQRFTVTLGADVRLSSKPFFGRDSIRDSRYALRDPSQFGRPDSAPPAVAVASYTVDGVAVQARAVVIRREAKLPYGIVEHELRVVPAVALTVAPDHAVIPLVASRKVVPLDVNLLNNVEGDTRGRLSLRLPSGWTAEPASREFAFARAGERATYRFRVTAPAIQARQHTIRAVATVAGRDYAEGYDLIDHRDLGLRYLYSASAAEVRGIDVQTVANLKVGYVMGVGDQVPDGIRQLGYEVTLLGTNELASGNLQQYDAIMTGTRAYAVREDLKTYNQRLLDYARSGGNLIVLYNTQEFDPNRYAPYRADLPQRAEEVSEEDSPVRILAPAHQAFTWPNTITDADFADWIEQRGSKFWTTWDKAYTAMIETFDQDQAPQRGGWLHARVGSGHYTYFAYAFHRQLPYGVPGAYRLLANVLALGKAPKP
ncbi:MAG: PIG-L family deacetylase [Acidobacteriota bacterium]